MMSNILIRPVLESDLPGSSGIHTHYVLNTVRAVHQVIAECRCGSSRHAPVRNGLFLEEIYKKLNFEWDCLT